MREDGLDFGQEFRLSEVGGEAVYTRRAAHDERDGVFDGTRQKILGLSSARQIVENGDVLAD